jgi:hypothetical protein
MYRTDGKIASLATGITQVNKSTADFQGAGAETWQINGSTTGPKIVQVYKLESPAQNLHQSFTLDTEVDHIHSDKRWASIGGTIDGFNKLTNTTLEFTSSSKKAYPSTQLVVSTTSPSIHSLLIDSDEINGSTTFTDSSSNGFTITANGDVQYSTAQAKVGNSSILFDGTGDYLSLADDEAFNFGSGDFTLEAWIRLDNVSGAKSIFAQWLSPQKSIYMRTNNSDLQFIYSVDGSSEVFVTASGALTATTWHHVAAVRSGNDFTLYVDGTSVQTADFTGVTFHNSTAIFQIGSTTTGAEYFNGYMEEMRVTKGEAVYTANFTAPVGYESKLSSINVNGVEILNGDVVYSESLSAGIQETVLNINNNDTGFIASSSDDGANGTIIISDTNSFIDSNDILPTIGSSSLTTSISAFAGGDEGVVVVRGPASVYVGGGSTLNNSEVGTAITASSSQNFTQQAGWPLDLYDEDSSSSNYAGYFPAVGGEDDWIQHTFDKAYEITSVDIGLYGTNGTVSSGRIMGLSPDDGVWYKIQATATDGVGGSSVTAGDWTHPDLGSGVVSSIFNVTLTPTIVTAIRLVPLTFTGANGNCGITEFNPSLNNTSFQYPEYPRGIFTGAKINADGVNVYSITDISTDGKTITTGETIINSSSSVNSITYTSFYKECK